VEAALKPLLEPFNVVCVIAALTTAPVVRAWILDAILLAAG
jgi:hypothetical protein